MGKNEPSAIEQSPFDLRIAFDGGTSGGKVLACYESGVYPCPTEEGFFLIPPAMRVLTKATYEARLEDFIREDSRSRAAGLDACLVSYDDPTTGKRVYWEVGETVMRPGLLSVSDRKFERSLAKILSFLGYMVNDVMKVDEPIALSLGILLPYDELGDRRLLAEWLRKTVGSFEFNGLPIGNIGLEYIDIKPEGYGIYRAYGPERLLIVGHSDSSWLCFTQGLLDTKISKTLPETGMHDFLRSLDFPITYELRAAQNIALAGEQLNSEYLVPLTQTRSDVEVQQLRHAIQDAKFQYWADRKEQFGSLDVGNVKQVPVSGGTAFFFANELNELFRDMFGIRLNWCRELMREFVERFSLRRGRDIPYRFADCYGYFRSLPGVTQYGTKAVEVVGGGSNG
jgi:hypothetical protein